VPTYLFENVDNESDVIEADYPSMRDAPPIGTLVCKEGVWFRRVVSPSQVSAGVHAVVHQYPYTSSVLPKGLPGCRLDKKRKPIIRSRAHEREVCAQYGYERE